VERVTFGGGAAQSITASFGGVTSSI